jgi:hypothetical protein
VLDARRALLRLGLTTRLVPLPSLIGHHVKCRKLLCDAAKRRETIEYGALATALGLKSPRQEWSTVLGPIADDEVKKTGHDLTLVVVRRSGRSPCHRDDRADGGGLARPQRSFVEHLHAPNRRPRRYPIANACDCFGMAVWGNTAGILV